MADSPVTCLPETLVPLKALGKGTYGAVYLCEDRSTGKEVAVKHIKNPSQCRKCILREVVLLARLRHENLVYLLDFVEVPSPDFKEVLLVMPYVKSNLHKVLRSKEDITNKHIQAITCQILRGLGYLHAAGVAHRDLKPGNVLIDQSCRVKICDFGLARGDMFEDGEVGDCEFTEYVVTRYYRAPEVMLLPRRYTNSVDMWSAGCILCECLSRKPIFPGKSHVDMVRLFMYVCGTPAAEDIAWVPAEGKSLLQQYRGNAGEPQFKAMFPTASPACLDLASQLLAWDPAKRPTAWEAQEHDYLRHLLPRNPPEVPETFDWSFDTFRPTVSQVQERLYAECALHHPEIVERDINELKRIGFFKETGYRPVVQKMDRKPLRSVTPPPPLSRRAVTPTPTTSPTPATPGRTPRSSTPPSSQTQQRTSTPPSQRGSRKNLTPPRGATAVAERVAAATRAVAGKTNSARGAAPGSQASTFAPLDRSNSGSTSAPRRERPGGVSSATSSREPSSKGLRKTAINRHESPDNASKATTATPDSAGGHSGAGSFSGPETMHQAPSVPRLRPRSVTGSAAKAAASTTVSARRLTPRGVGGTTQGAAAGANGQPQQQVTPRGTRRWSGTATQAAVRTTTPVQSKDVPGRVTPPKLSRPPSSMATRTVTPPRRASMPINTLSNNSNSSGGSNSGRPATARRTSDPKVGTANPPALRRVSTGSADSSMAAAVRRSQSSANVAKGVGNGLASRRTPPRTRPGELAPSNSAIAVGGAQPRGVRSGPS